MEIKLSKEEHYKEGTLLLQKAFYTGKYEYLAEATEKFEKIIEEDSENINALLCLSYISSILNKKDYSEILLKKILELDPFNKNAQKMLKEIITNNNPILLTNEKDKMKNSFLNGIMNQK